MTYYEQQVIRGAATEGRTAECIRQPAIEDLVGPDAQDFS